MFERFLDYPKNAAKAEAKEEKITREILQNAKLGDLKKEREELLEAMQWLPKPKRQKKAASSTTASSDGASSAAASGDTTPSAAALCDGSPGIEVPPNGPWSINVSTRFQGGVQVEVDVGTDDTGLTLKEKFQKATDDAENYATFQVKHQCLKMGSAKGLKIEDSDLLRNVLTNGAKVVVSRQR